MTEKYIEKTVDLLKMHEGFRRFPYKDTKGKLTVGYGINLDARGIYEKEAEFILNNEVSILDSSLRKIVKNYEDLSSVRKSVLINMCYQIGFSRFLKFVKTIRNIVKGDFNEAAYEMMNSKWGREFKTRATLLSDMMKYNKYV